ncbi:MAG TPA: hypothetical protein VK750_01115 [Cytophagaceae bacterium]|jgi:hypothetical protein|nr:hypothetical protein [Cytophagaceae bacterium]
MKKNVIFFLAGSIFGIVAFLFYQREQSPAAVAPQPILAKLETDAALGTGLIREGSDEIKALIKREREARNKRDSIHAVNREEVWVYQIGVNKEDPKAFENTYNILSRRIPNLYFFKQSDRSYLLVQHDGYNTEKELLSKQKEFETNVRQASITDSVHVINLTTYCSLRDEVKPVHEVKIVRKEWVVCYSCD